MDDLRRRLVGMVSALDVRYDFGEGHPLLGRRIPDLDPDPAMGQSRAAGRRPLCGSLGAAGGWHGARAIRSAGAPRRPRGVGW
ncbi:hypothetical protein P3T32_001267 [Ralstonia sp. GP73]|uniref:Uncharacterized protein n=1 Tax=Ralstonia thomasii TaxID=3058596 RepID=A0ABM9JVS2_9RALS|nr:MULTISPECIES: hypothetical protein [Ralstonia]MBT2180378.1 hypothetical protein [Ralstonia pickettii]MBX4001675.1 hypothetical protein [Ralstonia pickettii]MBX4028440.1 hypothetical protein [Ralstonia pickettii]MBX4069972.1 hypothetical protein [Ralstonia pickettii]MBX4075089.1 hypothetical protein [Ralstonia pickettii]